MTKYIIYSEELEKGEIEITAKNFEEARKKALEFVDIQRKMSYMTKIRWFKPI